MKDRSFISISLSRFSSPCLRRPHLLTEHAGFAATAVDSSHSAWTRVRKLHLMPSSSSSQNPERKCCPISLRGPGEQCSQPDLHRKCVDLNGKNRGIIVTQLELYF